MKKLIPLCLCILLMLPLAACRGLALRPFDARDFMPAFAILQEQSAGHLSLDVRATTASFEQIVEFYEDALFRLGAQQRELDDTYDNTWRFVGTYGDDERILQIAITDRGDEFIRVFVGFAGEVN